MAEAQAVDRVHRIGQSREVNVTRYCVSDSIEEVGQLYIILKRSTVYRLLFHLF